MKFEIKGLVKGIRSDLPCGCPKLTVKGKKAYFNDFGEMIDLDPENAPECGCGDMGFASVPATRGVLKKYDLTIDEYNKICEFFAKELHTGCCGLCS